MKKLIKLIVPIAIAVTFAGNAFSEVRFEGNTALSDRQLSAAVDPGSDPDVIRENISKLYQNLGYFDTEVEIKYVGRRKDINIMIREGNLSKLVDIDLDVSPDSLKLILDDARRMYEGHPASQRSFMNLAEECVEILSNNGRPFARGQWSGFSLDNNGDIIAEFKLIPGPFAVVSDVKFNGINRTRSKTLRKASGLETGAPFSREKVLRAEKFIEKLPYIEISSPYYLESSREGDSCTVTYNIRELPSTSVEGFGGLIDSPAGTDFVGRANIEFGDILGTGRMFSLYWNKKDARSNELSVRYLEPYIFNSRIDLEIEIFQLDRDTLFVTTGAKGSLIHRFGVDLSGKIYGSVERTVPESGSEITRSIRRAVGTTFNFDKTDFDPNPRSGYMIETELEYRYRSNTLVEEGRNPPSNMTSAGFGGAVYLQLSGRFVTAFLLKSWGIVSSNGDVPADEFRYIGGIRDLRGYTEERFPAYRYVIPGIEMRLLSGRYSRIYLFGDFGFIKASQYGDKRYEFKPGYGPGIVTRTGIGSVRVEVGWGDQDFPDGAVLNFAIDGKF